MSSPLASQTVGGTPVNKNKGGGVNGQPDESVLHGSVSAPGAKGVGSMSVAERAALFGGSR